MDSTLAFPSQAYGQDGLPSHGLEGGMLLRDWFAGQAMAAMLTNVMGRMAGEMSAYAYGDCNAVIVDRAYVIADVMMAARAISDAPDA